MNKQNFSYLLFVKMHRLDLMTRFTNAVKEQNSVTPAQASTLQHLAKSYLQVLTSQLKRPTFDHDVLEYWVQMHTNETSPQLAAIFKKAMRYAGTSTLTDMQHQDAQQLSAIHTQLLDQCDVFFQKWQIQLQADDPFFTWQDKQLDQFSVELIQHNSIDDLPALLTKAEEIFGFRRCIFFSYNPWLNEFSGVIGKDLPKIRRMRGNIESEPVFFVKKPLFLKDPAPYVQQIAIDLFDLSSVIFIPIHHEQQLYGWLSFDQMGEEFDCPKALLDLLEQVGLRLGMYLGRKHPTNKMMYDVSFSEKDYAILHLLSEGYSNKEMAELLYLSEYTIRDYIQKFMIKLQAKNRTQIISIAFRMGIID